MNGPDAVVGLLQADVVLFERVGDEQQPFLEANGARVGHHLDDKVPGVFDRGQAAGVGAVGRPVQRRRGLAVQCLVRPLFVIEAAETVEPPLLRRQISAGRPNRFPLQGAVHPFRRAVLLRMRRQDALVLYPQPHLPRAELRKPVNPGGSKRGGG